MPALQAESLRHLEFALGRRLSGQLQAHVRALNREMAWLGEEGDLQLLALHLAVSHPFAKGGAGLSAAL
jgi:hypothetical protein